MAKLDVRKHTGLLVVALVLAAGGVYQFLQITNNQPAEPMPPPPTISAADICTQGAWGSNCWIELANQQGCYVWLSGLMPGHTIHWTGECSDGLGEGQGQWTEAWEPGEVVIESKEEGSLAQGRKQGPWIANLDNGALEGSYLDGQRDGIWTSRHSNGDTVEERYLLGTVIESCARRTDRSG